MKKLSFKITLLATLLYAHHTADAMAIGHASLFSFQQDSLPKNDTLRYPLQDRRGDKLSQKNKNPFDLRDPSNFSDSIVYDPKTKEYYIVEKVGG